MTTTPINTYFISLNNLMIVDGHDAEDALEMANISFISWVQHLWETNQLDLEIVDSDEEEE